MGEKDRKKVTEKVFEPKPFSLTFAYAMVRVQVGKELPKIIIEELSKKKRS